MKARQCKRTALPVLDNGCVACGPRARGGRGRFRGVLAVPTGPGTIGANDIARPEVPVFRDHRAKSRSLKRLGSVRIGDVLADWGEHEIEGRLIGGRRVPRSYLDQFIGPRRRLEAIRVILQARFQVVAAILAANPTEWVAVEVSKADLPSIRVMHARSLADYSRSKLAEPGDSGDWVRRLADGAADVGGPMLAIARSLGGSITIFDGLHRMAAWVAHLDAGRDYPVKVTVVLTPEIAPQFEMPP